MALFECRCPPPLADRYWARISAPLLDRIDLQIEVPSRTVGDLLRDAEQGLFAGWAAARYLLLARLNSFDMLDKFLYCYRIVPLPKHARASGAVRLRRRLLLNPL